MDMVCCILIPKLIRLDGQVTSPTILSCLPVRKTSRDSVYYGVLCNDSICMISARFTGNFLNFPSY